MEKIYNFVIWGGAEYFKGIGTPVAIAKQLAKLHNILYIEHPFTLLRFLFYKTKGEFIQYLKNRLHYPFFLRKIEKNTYLMTAFKFPIFPISYPSLIRRFNMKINRLFIKKFLNKQGFNNTIFIAFTPLPFEILNSIDIRFKIYYCIDEYTETDYLKNAPKIKDEVLKIEKQILENSDITFFTSTYLSNKKSYLSQKNRVLENGVHDVFFQKNLKIPEKLKNISKPIIGYCGGFTSYVGYEFLEKISNELPECSIILLGGGFLPKQLTKLPNIHYFGLLPYTDIPAYIQNFDVCLILYLTANRTNAIFPLKLYEYFAQGKPVVSTPLPSLLSSTSLDKNLIYFADNSEEFVSQIKKALKEDSDLSRKRRINLAQQNTWDKRTKQLLHFIEEQMLKSNI